MEKRWLSFFLITFGVILFLNSRMESRRQAYLKQNRLEAARAADQAQKETRETSATLASVKKQLEKAGPPPETSLRAPGEAEKVEEEAVALEDAFDAPLIDVRTRSLHVSLSALGGLPVRWELLNIKGAAHQSGDPSTSGGLVNLIPEGRSPQRDYPLTFEGRPIEIFNRVPHKAERKDLPKGDIEITMTSEERKGLQVIRTYRFPAEGYLVSLGVEIRNASDLQRRFDDGGAGMGIGWQGGFLQPEESTRVTGDILALVSKPSGIGYEKPKAGADPAKFDGPIRWTGVERKFFLAALIPDKANPATTALITVRERDMTDGFRKKGISPPVSSVLFLDRIELEPGQSKRLDFHLFAGPKKTELLQEVDKVCGMSEGRLGLQGTVFLGYWKIIRWLGLVLLRLLQWLHEISHNYGLAIIFLTILVRLAVYPLTHKSMKIQAQTMAQQAKLKPYIDEINRKYKDDMAARNQAMMKLWKEHGVNPFGMLRGCVPVLLQMPIFIALYVLLDQAIELRGQSFLWISDLSAPDRLLSFGAALPLVGDSFNLLPFLMGATQVVSSMMTMNAATDPTQKQMMIIMPLAFIFILYSFPSGLMLYWVVGNAWQIGQQALTNRMIKREQMEKATA